MEIARIENLPITYKEEEKEKQTTVFKIEPKDKILLSNTNKNQDNILDYILGKKEIKVFYKGKKIESLYPKEKEIINNKIIIIDNNENNQIKENQKIITQLKKSISESTNLKKNIYNSFVLHQKEKVKDIKKRKKEIIENLCKDEVLTINEGTKKYKQLLKEEKNRLVINKLEARNEYIAEKARLQVKLENKNIKKEIKYNSKDIKEEINKIIGEMKINNITFLNKTISSYSQKEKKLINLLFAFCGKKDILIFLSSLYDKEEMKIINKLILEKEMALIYITNDKNVEKTYFNKEIER